MYKMGQYIPGGSFIHRLDPRIKILSLIVLSIMILRGGIISGIIMSGFLIALIPASGLSPHHIIKALRPMVFFFILLFILHAFFTQGTPIPPFPLWCVTITYEGLERGALITWQLTLLILSASILTMTTSPSELVNGIENLLRPLKLFGIPSHDIAIMISIALRFMPTILEEIDRIREAQISRGAHFKSGTIIQRIKAARSLLMPVISNLLRRADELSTAMEGRGYKRGPRTYMGELHMTRADYGAIVVMILITVLNILIGHISLVWLF